MGGENLATCPNDVAERSRPHLLHCQFGGLCLSLSKVDFVCYLFVITITIMVMVVVVIMIIVVMRMFMLLLRFVMVCLGA